MNKFSLFLPLLLLFNSFLNAQALLKIDSDIALPEDSIESKALLTSVESFLSLAQENIENKWILESENIETQILIDEIEDIQKSEKFESDTFYNAYLTNVVAIDTHQYQVDISYLGISDNSAKLRASFRLIAHKSNDSFLISSPLKMNTQNWQTERIQNHIFHYPYTIDFKRVKEFCDLTIFFDEKLNNSDVESHYYLCEREMNPLELFGVGYKSDYNGDEVYSSSKSFGKYLLVDKASGFYDFNTHDLWHYRLSQVKSRREVHRRVDCHIATLYGGLWGLSWEELFPLFSEKFVVGKNVDWLGHKNNSSHFITQGKRKNYSDDFVGALLVKKIEKENGFDGVWQLLLTKRTKSEDEYFQILEKLTGITRENYNKEVFKLIQEEMKNFGL